jgi:hypothetical protein
MDLQPSPKRRRLDSTHDPLRDLASSAWSMRNLPSSSAEIESEVFEPVESLHQGTSPLNRLCPGIDFREAIPNGPPAAPQNGAEKRSTESYGSGFRA